MAARIARISTSSRPLVVEIVEYKYRGLGCEFSTRHLDIDPTQAKAHLYIHTCVRTYIRIFYMHTYRYNVQIM